MTVRNALEEIRWRVLHEHFYSILKILLLTIAAGYPSDEALYIVLGCPKSYSLPFITGDWISKF
jgi:hypothetical protein